MTVDDKAEDRSTYAEQTYVFCSSTCKAKFDREPEKYAVLVAEKFSGGASHDA